jgi:hypothetical protein
VQEESCQASGLLEFPQPLIFADHWLQWVTVTEFTDDGGDVKVLSIRVTTPRRHTGTELRFFLTSALLIHGCERWDSLSGRSVLCEWYPATHCIDNWVGPKACLDVLAKRKMPDPAWNRSPILQLVDYCTSHLQTKISRVKKNCWLYKQVRSCRGGKLETRKCESEHDTNYTKEKPLLHPSTLKQWRTVRVIYSAWKQYNSVTCIYEHILHQNLGIQVFLIHSICFRIAKHQNNSNSVQFE